MYPMCSQVSAPTELLLPEEHELQWQIHFWIFFLGVSIMLFPTHFLGLAADMRRGGSAARTQSACLPFSMALAACSCHSDSRQGGLLRP